LSAAGDRGVPLRQFSANPRLRSSASGDDIGANSTAGGVAAGAALGAAGGLLGGGDS
jgi:hypothetical protein